MVLQLAHHVQTCLHQHNKPQLSFYDKMMADKRKEEERLQAVEHERLQMEIEANKEREENEVKEKKKHSVFLENLKFLSTKDYFVFVIGFICIISFWHMYNSWQ